MTAWPDAGIRRTLRYRLVQMVSSMSSRVRVSAMCSANPHQEACLPRSVLEIPKRQLSVVEEDLPVGPVRHRAPVAPFGTRPILRRLLPGELRRRPGPSNVPGRRGE